MDSIEKEIERLMPRPKAAIKNFKNALAKWDNTEPIMAYFKRHLNDKLRKYAVQILIHSENQEEWKKWRYNLRNRSVKAQIGHLSPEALDIWQNDYFKEIGPEIRKERVAKIKKMRTIFKNAVLNENPFIYNLWRNYYEQIKKMSHRRSKITDQWIDGLKKYARQIDILIQFNNLSRIEKTLNEILIPGKQVLPKKIKSSINLLLPYLPENFSRELIQEFRQLNPWQKIFTDDLITLERREIFKKRIKEIQTDADRIVKDSDIWQKLQINKADLANLTQFHQRRQELRTFIDLLRLNNLSPELLERNLMAEKKRDKTGQTLKDMLDGLKRFFKNTLFVNELRKIENIFKIKQRLAMLFTDNPQILWQVGVYPLGCNSCVHYADGSFVNQLMGYVGDANSKVAYLINLNKIPEIAGKKFTEEEFEELRNKIPAQNLLEASLARAIIKIAKNQQDKTVILLEPIYTKSNKNDQSTNECFIAFLNSVIARPMKAKMAQDGGRIRIKVAASRSPNGQYEDTSLSNVKYI